MVGLIISFALRCKLSESICFNLDLKGQGHRIFGFKGGGGQRSTANKIPNVDLPLALIGDVGPTLNRHWVRGSCFPGMNHWRPTFNAVVLLYAEGVILKSSRVNMIHSSYVGRTLVLRSLNRSFWRRNVCLDNHQHLQMFGFQIKQLNMRLWVAVHIGA